MNIRNWRYGFDNIFQESYVDPKGITFTKKLSQITDLRISGNIYTLEKNTIAHTKNTIAQK